eukprot:jgi/Mesvir1/15675/Mv03272-RA.1
MALSLSTLSCQAYVSSARGAAPLLVAGSANVDLFLDINRIPAPGETLSSRSGVETVLPGGKGLNQAIAAHRLGGSTRFVGRFGRSDPYTALLRNALKGVDLTLCEDVAGVGCGKAIILVLPSGENSIILVGGANMLGWGGAGMGAGARASLQIQVYRPPFPIREDMATLVERIALAVKGFLAIRLREVPHWVNAAVAHAAHAAGNRVLLDMGGEDSPLDTGILAHIHTLSPNETELARLVGTPVAGMDADILAGSDADILAAARKVQSMGARNILVKRGTKGSMLLTEEGSVYWQTAHRVDRVVDTVGAGDTFTAAYAVMLAEGRPVEECLAFASAAASLCVERKGAEPPSREQALGRVARGVA